MAKLGEVCTFFSGTGFPNKFQGNRNGKYPFYKVGDISKNVLLGTQELKYCENYIDDNVVKEIHGTILPPQTIVFAKIGEALRLNRRAITENYCLIDNNAMGIHTNNNNLNTRYLYYFMCSIDLQSYCESTTIPSVRKSRIAEIELPLPPLDEQRKIAAVLDKVSDLIAKRRQQLKKLDELVKSRFIEMFGDCDLSKAQTSWMTIKDIGTVASGATPKTEQEEFWGGPYRWITPAELEADSGYIFDSVRKLTKAGVESCSLQEMPTGTVLLSSRAPIGKLAIAGNPFYCNQGFKNIICNETIIPRYLYTLLLLNVDYLNSLGRGATFKEISKTIVENICIPVPSLDLQNRFAAFVAQTDKTKTAIQKSLEKLEILKKALMQEYFG